MKLEMYKYCVLHIVDLSSRYHDVDVDQCVLTSGPWVNTNKLCLSTHHQAYPIHSHILPPSENDCLCS